MGTSLLRNPKVEPVSCKLKRGYMEFHVFVAGWFADHVITVCATP